MGCSPWGRGLWHRRAEILPPRHRFPLRHESFPLLGSGRRYGFVRFQQ